MIGRAIGFGIVAAASLALAPSALATTVSVNRTGWHVTADAAVDNNDFQMGHMGEDPTYCPDSPHGCFYVSDGSSSIITGAHCFIQISTPSVARCKDPGGRVPVTVKARDGDDNVAAQGVSDPRPSKIPITLKLGPGHDAGYTGKGKDTILGQAGDDDSPGGLFSGPANDVIRGGPGEDYEAGEGGNDEVGGPQDTEADYLNGNAGADLVDARDGVADYGIDCGPGSDTLRRDAALDPAPTDCSP